MKTRIIGLLFVSIALFGGVSSAHHSFFAVYDGQNTVTVKGTVTQFRMVNPHAMMLLDVTDTDGSEQSWTVEFDGRLHLSRAGWSRDTFKIGEVLEVTGNPAHSGSDMMFFNQSVDANGAVIRRPRLELEDSIEEQRRQRRAQRDAQN